MKKAVKTTKSKAKTSPRKKVKRAAPKAVEKITAAKKTRAKQVETPQAMSNEAQSLYMQVLSDPAKSPGHRKMNLKGQMPEKTGHKTHPQNSTALNHMSQADKFQRTSAKNRRIITGAALGKTGQQVLK